MLAEDLKTPIQNEFEDVASRSLTSVTVASAFAPCDGDEENGGEGHWKEGRGHPPIGRCTSLTMTNWLAQISLQTSKKPESRRWAKAGIHTFPGSLGNV